MFMKQLLRPKSRLMTGSLCAGIGFLRSKSEEEIISIKMDSNPMNQMILFGGQSHSQFTQSIADRLGVKVGSMRQETFSNSEHSLQIQVREQKYFLKSYK